MIPYFTAFLLLGLPLAYIEWSIARYGGMRGFHSAPGIFSVLWQRRAAPYLGVLGLVVPIGIYMYYVFIQAWCLYYCWGYISGALNLGRDVSAYQGFFENFTGSGAFKSGERHAAAEQDSTNETETTSTNETEATSTEEQEAAENE